MKPRNFPARKLERQLQAQGKAMTAEEYATARAIRTKKTRGAR